MTWQEHARQLAADLVEQGVLDPGWRAAFENVPRHVFVPTVFAHDGTLHVPGIVQVLGLPDRGTRILRTDDGSWVEISSDGMAHRAGHGHSLTRSPLCVTLGSRSTARSGSATGSP